MTDLDPDGTLAALLADPLPDRAFAAKVDALVEAERLYAARRHAAWGRFGREAAGAVAVAIAAALVATAPGSGVLLALVAATLPVAWLMASGVMSPDSATAR